jgi:3-oxoacyl-[acyl-carrier-protein] synthase I
MGVSDTLAAHHFGWGGPGAPLIVDVSTINGLAQGSYQTWAFRRAEMTAFVGSPFRLPSGNPLTFGRVRQLDPRLVGGDRLASLAKRALVGIWGTIAAFPKEAQLGIVLCLPERMDTDHAEERDRRARARLESYIAGPLLQQGYSIQLRTIARGHASFAYALAEVGPLLNARRLDGALILGIDSYYDPHVLERLFEEERVLDSDWRDAFVPGEAATGIMVTRHDVARHLGYIPLATVESVATNEEVATVDNDVGLLGLGLSRPAVAVCKKMKEHNAHLDWWINDVTGESFRLQEFSLAWPRAAHLAMTDVAFDFLPSNLGDLGAATMPTAAAIAIEGMRRGDPGGQFTMITGSSDHGSRGVVLLRAR